MARSKHNDKERRQWIENDEGLYVLFYLDRTETGITLRDFIKQNRAEIDEVIDNVTSGRKPAHYLKYGR